MTKRRLTTKERVDRIVRGFKDHLASVDARIEDEMRPLQVEIELGPRPNETMDQFGKRVARELHANLDRFVPYRPSKRGRPPKTLGAGRRISKAEGRPREYDLAAIARLVEERVAKALTSGRRLTRPAALREQFAEEMKKREPARYVELRKLQRHFEDADSLSPERALCRAFNHPKMKSGHPNYQTLARQLSYALVGRPASRR